MAEALLVLLGAVLGVTARAIAPTVLSLLHTAARRVRRRLAGGGRHTRVGWMR